MQLTDPVEGVKVPAGQSEQLDEPIPDEYVPSKHEMHELEPLTNW
jgi:hypothetical protein